MKMNVSRSLFIAVSGASWIALSVAGPAQADRKPAPIVYADLGQSGAVTAPSPAPSTQAPSLTKDSRVSFRYPGQAGPSAASVSITASQGTAPSAPVYASTRMAPSATIAPAPSSSAVNFNVPSAAPLPAAPIAAAPSQPIRIASLGVESPVPTGKPLTLSKVSAKKDAAIDEERGRASIYVDGFNGQPTANGEIFDETAMTAAHPSLPLPSLVQVINEDNSREVVVRINDRGPFDGKRILELSPRAGSVLGMSKGSSANVRIRYLGPAPVQQASDQFASADIEQDVMPPLQTASAAPQLPVRIEAGAGSLAGAALTPTYATPTYSAPVSVANLSVSAPAAVGNVYIQAGSFADIANAQRLTQNLRGDLPVKIEEARVHGGDFFRVLIGPFPNMDDAALEQDYLSRSVGIDGFLTTR